MQMRHFVCICATRLLQLAIKTRHTHKRPAWSCWGLHTAAYAVHCCVCCVLLPGAHQHVHQASCRLLCEIIDDDCCSVAQFAGCKQMYQGEAEKGSKCGNSVAVTGWSPEHDADASDRVNYIPAVFVAASTGDCLENKSMSVVCALSRVGSFVAAAAYTVLIPLFARFVMWRCDQCAHCSPGVTLRFKPCLFTCPCY